MLWKVVANKLCVVVCKPMAWMTSYVFKSWMTSLNVHFERGRRFELWTNMLSIHVSVLVGVNHLVFSLVI